MKRALMGLLLALGCRHGAMAPAEVRAEPTVAAVTDAAAPGVRPDASTAVGLEQRLSRLADDLATRVSAIRGLPARGPIARGVMSRDAVVSRIRERTRQEYPPGEVELEGELLKRLGMIPDAMDYERTIYELLEEQVLGFYDPDARRLYIADWVPESMQPVTMAHELTHALQDQHFDIGRYVHHVQGASDRQTAAMAVIEGDATAAMMDFTLAPMRQRVTQLPNVETLIANQLQSTDQARLAAAPRAMRETLLFPYVAGFGMCVREMRDGGGYPAVDALLRRPPESTEQVMHAEKLRARELPVDVPVQVPAPLAGDHRVAYQDVMGELGLWLYLVTALGDDAAREAAAGWGGDRAMLLAPRAGVTDVADGGVRVSRAALGNDALVWVVEMDRAAEGPADGEATSLARAATAVLQRRYVSAPSVAVRGAAAARAVAQGRVSLVAQRGTRVLIADRVPAERAAAVVTAALR
ncbi:MAG: DUF6782 family putative metallopeptidase [Polyangiales bacterium]